MTINKILVTGGTGYIGSHTTVHLLNAGYEVVIYDNLVNSSESVVEGIRQITKGSLKFVKGDIRDRAGLKSCFQSQKFDAVFHFAGHKSVGESAISPLKYFDNNVSGSITLFDEMLNAGVHTLVFSSSATVYGDPGYPKYDENTPTNPVNVYGKSKLDVERIAKFTNAAFGQFKVALMRYFNPVGASSSGKIGENPQGIPNNLMPYISQVAIGRIPKLQIFGNDWPTRDGTGLRDYIHVEDLAAGHLAALNYLNQGQHSIITVNLGTGRSHSVLEVIRSFETVSGQHIPFEFVGRRHGDLAEYYANTSLANNLLGWTAKHDLRRMCEDTWRWIKNY